MTDEFKILGQVGSDGATLLDLYTVPDNHAAIISSLVVANRGAAAHYRVAARPGGASISNEQYLAFDVAIAANDSKALRFGMTLGAGDVVSVRGDSANLSFNLFGAEKS